MRSDKWKQSIVNGRLVFDDRGHLVANFEDHEDALACVEAHNAPMTALVDRPGERGQRVWLIRKGGFYYGPKFSGYTAEKDAAGRYTEDEARRECEVEPWHMKAVHEDNLPRTPLDDARATIADLAAQNAQQSARADKAEQDLAQLTVNAGTRLDEKDAEIARLREALATYIYETTSLSPLEDDGGHWCKISKACLEGGRRALAPAEAEGK